MTIRDLIQLPISIRREGLFIEYGFLSTRMRLNLYKNVGLEFVRKHGMYDIMITYPSGIKISHKTSLEDILK